MRIRNSTDFPEKLIREVVRFTKPQDVSYVWMQIKNRSARKLSGHASYSRNSVVVSIGPASEFPSKPVKNDWLPSVKYGKIRRFKRGGYLGVPWLANRTEALVYVMAHEMRHMWQGKHPKGWRVWGARGQYSERDADAYALRKLREWRKRK